MGMSQQGSEKGSANYVQAPFLRHPVYQKAIKVASRLLDLINAVTKKTSSPGYAQQKSEANFNMNLLK